MSVQHPCAGAPPQNITMVAVDKDKNSAHAFRWAVNHLDNPIIIAVHVKQKNFSHHVTNVFPPDEEDVANIFNNLRAMCNRKAVTMKEAVIDDSDVVRGLLEFANRNLIHTIVVGATTKSPLTSLKKFKAYQYQDIPTTMIKSAPDYCSVYIISKLKIVSARSAVRSLSKSFNPLPRQLPVQAIPTSESEGNNGSLRTQPPRSRGSYEGELMRMPMKQRGTGSSMSVDNIDAIAQRPRHLSVDDRELPGLATLDMTKQDPDVSESVGASSTPNASKDLEAEMQRLRLELKQTMDMYSSARKQAISANHQAEQIRQWKEEEERKVEVARLSEEAALAMAEKEKAKAKAAMEAAEEARKRAELEAMRRMDAEIKAKIEAEETDRALSALAKNDSRYRKYTIEEIEIATENFSSSKKIGEGGYGPVFKGQLDHTSVAIKILKPDASQGRKQFQQEVEVLSCIRHPNMVLLLGACPEHGCLVYEYMDNGSLEDRLFRKNNTRPISWKKRFQIAAEIATALLFLHQNKPEPIVHRDLKPSNILLDRNYVSKISDVGLARLVPQSVADTVTQYYMTSAAGTFCYIDPEYQQSGILTPMSDIYSLGIMLLQIITAKPPIGLAHQVRRALEKGNFEDVLDPTVTDWPVEEAKSFAKLALACSQLSKKDRPNLATAVLPELNRLSELGYSFQNSQFSYNSDDSRSNSYASRPPTPTRSQHSGSQYSGSQHSGSQYSGSQLSGSQYLDSEMFYRT